ncbi:MAG: TIGR04149 family rSAM-modified RiPP [Cytophagales bacterium]|nr:TIGR04149 family rSAM-modified RiPP [Cytophagales bacterium]MCA6366657.1 TIGR04149 family rSAM-modified RiPP [Cytophagales bacterium]MCA6370068.1 TIGR04149 family rSAM-modified RiPP [Cytophagales bacterium]MCA6375249.1 TIGR04149 family rSAM-modified RiPP [Cytophagales bacterium]MCA6384304.1 TIGR04149 family rSAM-modified RiPP [Cytophagales bacterium]
MEKKKLSLNKLSVTELGNKEMVHVKGGYSFTCSLSIYSSCQKYNSKAGGHGALCHSC